MTGAQIVGSNGLYGRCTFGRFLEAQRRLGISRMAFHHLPAHLWMDHIRTIGGTELCHELEQAGIRAVSFHPGRFQYSLFEPVSTLRGANTLAYHRRCLEMAQALGCSTLCLRPAGSLLDGDPQAELDALAEHLDRLCGEAAGNVTICIQTVLPEEGALLHTIQALSTVLERVPQTGVLLDTVPMSCAGETIGQWFAAFGDRIRHVRFQDGRNSGCRIWGQGVYPSRRYAGQLHRAGYAGPISITDRTERYQDAPEAADAQGLARVRALLDGLREE